MSSESLNWDSYESNNLSPKDEYVPSAPEMSTQESFFPLPNIDENFHRIGPDVTYYSVVDLASSFNQILLDDDAAKKRLFT